MAEIRTTLHDFPSYEQIVLQQTMLNFYVFALLKLETSQCHCKAMLRQATMKQL